jgi:hypothetical protein
VIKVSPEWVTSLERTKSSGRVATFSLLTGVISDGISYILDETNYTAVTRSSLPRLWQQGIPREVEGDCWVGEAIVLPITRSIGGL